MTKFESSMVRVIAAVVTLLCASAGARAEGTSDDAVAKITQLNKDAVAALQAKKYEDARKMLKEALDLSDSAGLDQHPITARTHIHMGIVIIVGFKQRDLGIKQFKKALEIQSTINLTKALVTPELTDAFAEAKGGGAPAATPAATPAEPAEPPATETPPAPATPATPPPEAGPEVPTTGLVHEPVTDGKKGSAISITVGVQADLKFDKIVLAYRPEGATEFLGREMSEVAEGRFGAEIPTTATVGASVAYYIEADDSEGNAVAARGSVDKPLVINLGGAHAARHKSEEEEGEEEEDEGPDHQYFLALLGGTGFGYATGVGDTNHDTMISPAGIAPASLFQIEPEFGYWLSSSLMVSLQLRYQHVSGTTDVVVGGKTYHTANYAFAAFGKATWKFGENSLHPFFSLEVGVGQIRHVVTLKQLKNTCGTAMNQACVDTIAAGPFMAGPGGGVFYDLTDNLSLVGEVDSVIAAPNFTFNIDVNIGVAYGF